MPCLKRQEMLSFNLSVPIKLQSILGERKCIELKWKHVGVLVSLTEFPLVDALSRYFNRWLNKLILYIAFLS